MEKVKNNSNKIYIAIIVLLLIIIGVMGFFLIKKDENVKQEEIKKEDKQNENIIDEEKNNETNIDELSKKVIINDFDTEKHYFTPNFYELKTIDKDLDTEVKYTYKLKEKNVTLTIKYHLDYNQYKQNKDLEMSISYKVFINDKEITNKVENLYWAEVFDENYIIARNSNSAYSEYYFIDYNGNVVKSMISSANGQEDGNGYVLYKDNVPYEIVYFTQACNKNEAYGDRGIENHIKYDNGTFGEETKIINYSLTPEGADLCAHAQ